MGATEVPLARNQALARSNELDVEGEARLYRALRHFWHPVIFSHEVTQTPRRVTLVGQDLVVVRLEGEISVFNDLCAHRGTALSLGTVVNDGTALRCAYHGWQYDREGLCVLAPQRPDLSKHLRARIKKHHSAERFGMVWVCLENEPRFPLPDFPQFDDDSYTKVFLDCEDWACSAPRRTENYCDLGHFAFVHDGYLGDINRPEVPDHKALRNDRCQRMDVETSEPAHSGKYDALRHTGEVITISKWHVYMPLTVRLDICLPEGHTYVLFFHPTPVGPRTTRNFTVGACNYGDPERTKTEIASFQKIVYDQDRPILESQRPEELPEDLSLEMYLKGVDTFHVTYRSWLVELMRELVPADAPIDLPSAIGGSGEG